MILGISHMICGVSHVSLCVGRSQVFSESGVHILLKVRRVRFLNDVLLQSHKPSPTWDHKYNRTLTVALSEEARIYWKTTQL